MLVLLSVLLLRSLDCVSLHFRFILEDEGGGIKAVAKSCWGRAVGKDMAEVAATAGAEDLGAFHAEGGVGVLEDILFGKGTEEARPASARVELGIGGKERESASCAEIDAVLVIIEEVTAEGRLCSLGAKDAVGGGAELFLPFGIGFDDAGRLDNVTGLAIWANESDGNGGIGISHGRGVGEAADRDDGEQQRGRQDESEGDESHAEDSNPNAQFR